MKTHALVVAIAMTIVAAAPLAHADKIVASGAVKAFKGPEGAVVLMVEINDSKEMLVLFKNTGGTIEGKTQRYRFEDLGKGTKNVYIDVKRGSKTNRNNLCSARDGEWECYVPGKPSDTLPLQYSEDLSSKTKLDDVLAAYKP